MKKAELFTVIIAIICYMGISLYVYYNFYPYWVPFTILSCIFIFLVLSLFVATKENDKLKDQIKTQASEFDNDKWDMEHSFYVRENGYKEDIRELKEQNEKAESKGYKYAEDKYEPYKISLESLYKADLTGFVLDYAVLCYEFAETIGFFDPLMYRTNKGYKDIIDKHAQRLVELFGTTVEDHKKNRYEVSKYLKENKIRPIARKTAVGTNNDDVPSQYRKPLKHVTEERGI